MNRRRLLGLLPLLPLAAKAQSNAIYPIGQQDDTKIPSIGPGAKPLVLPICDHEWNATGWRLGFSDTMTTQKPPSVEACSKCGTLRSKDFIKG